MQIGSNWSLFVFFFLLESLYFSQRGLYTRRQARRVTFIGRISGSGRGHLDHRTSSPRSASGRQLAGCGRNWWGCPWSPAWMLHRHLFEREIAKRVNSRTESVTGKSGAYTSGSKRRGTWRWPGGWHTPEQRDHHPWPWSWCQHQRTGPARQKWTLENCNWKHQRSRESARCCQKKIHLKKTFIFGIKFCIIPAVAGEWCGGKLSPCREAGWARRVCTAEDVALWSTEVGH